MTEQNKQYEQAKDLLQAMREQAENPAPPVTKMQRAAQEVLDMLATGGDGKEFTMEDLHNAEIVGHRIAGILAEKDEDDANLETNP
jgi:hypothetical protein